MEQPAPAIVIESVATKFEDTWVHQDVSFSVEKGSIVALIGMSGCGKSVLLREIIGLLRPTSGHIQIFGSDIWTLSESALGEIRNRFGVLFQNGALFSSLSVEQNVAVPLREQMELAPALLESIVELRLALSGLSPSVGSKMPSELSGGMRKRVALARALALEPEILFLDEPTSGLDPINARAFDTLIRTLSDSLGLTVLLVTHDLDTLEGIVDKVVVLGEGRVLAEGPVREVSIKDHPWIKTYFSSRVR